VAVAFAVFGTFWGSWAVAAIDVERFLRVSHAGLGTVLALAVVGGTVANAVGGTLAERHGTRAALSTCLVAWAVSLGVLSVMEPRVAFIAVFVVSVAIGGGVDVVMNVAASAAMVDAPGRLLRFHALFNAGAVAGAGATALLTHSGVSWRAVWAGIAVSALVLAFAVARTDLPAGEPGEHVSIRDGLAALSRAGLIRLAVVFALAAMVEGGIDTWGVLFLRSRLAIGVLAGAAAYVAGQALATTARASAGGMARGIHSGRGASLGALLAGGRRGNRPGRGRSRHLDVLALVPCRGHGGGGATGPARWRHHRRRLRRLRRRPAGRGLGVVGVGPEGRATRDRRRCPGLRRPSPVPGRGAAREVAHAGRLLRTRNPCGATAALVRQRRR